MRTLLLIALLLAGCDRADPYRRQWMWQPEGVNQANLQAQVADPRVLLRGHGITGATRDAGDAADRLMQGHPIGFNALGGAGPSGSTPSGPAPSAAPPAPSPGGS